jgi:hypothetical protein
MSGNAISEYTRRDLFDHLTLSDIDWSGGMAESDFFGADIQDFATRQPRFPWRFDVGRYSPPSRILTTAVDRNGSTPTVGTCLGARLRSSLSSWVYRNRSKPPEPAPVELVDWDAENPF